MIKEPAVYFISTRRGRLFIFDPDGKHNLKSVIKNTVIDGLIRSELMSSTIVAIRKQFALDLVDSMGIKSVALAVIELVNFNHVIDMENHFNMTTNEQDVLNKIARSRDVEILTRSDILVIESPFTFLQHQENIYNEH